MPQGGPFPRTDAEFNEYFQRAEPHLITNWDALVPAHPGMPDSRKKELEDKYKQWTGSAASPGIYPKSQNPDVRTKTITGQKDTLRGEIESLLRDIYEDIPDSWLSPSDREILNIHLRDREPSPHPQIVDPIIGLTNKSGGDVELRVRTTTDSTNASKPLDHVLVQTQYTLTAANDPAPPFEQCLQHYESSHALSMMHLGISNVGKRFYGYFRWYDPIHPEDSGPWTQVHTIMVA